MALAAQRELSSICRRLSPALQTYALWRPSVLRATMNPSPSDCCCFRCLPFRLPSDFTDAQLCAAINPLNLRSCKLKRSTHAKGIEHHRGARRVENDGTGKGFIAERSAGQDPNNRASMQVN